ncbi:SoxR reducing system RseC family protein [Rhodovulum euryhalinum]|uniref:RseC/MucC-like positive regulator of sigma(E) n=1 Tax=Rhodovulum euryhalinum TaxID=35805 RepID=A0A4V2SAG6_9RHOB|nr:SoxR reducing system RseC family protein [Rhodovulum euryhalinum]TCO71610.1 RseC/MucC-like positive regulator of sigma(E) [Rhodovulum euryhalinum]
MHRQDDSLGDDLAPRALSERLRVIAVSGGRLHLAADRAAGCAACAMRKGCGAAALSAGVRPAVIEIACPAGILVAPGDEVEVSIPGGRFLAAVGLAYLLPTMAVVIVAALSLALGLSDLWAALLCLPVLALALVPAARAERRGRLSRAMRIDAVYPAASLPRCGT